jgi:predicted esterase
MSLNPHHGQTVAHAGAPLGAATAAMVMVHGRGATSRSILEIVPAIAVPGMAFLAPQAAGSQWYPNRFMDPIESNEPWLSSALGLIDDVVDSVRLEGIAPERLLLLGFSQGACLALEYAARRVRRYGGIVGLSGGLIGPDGTPRDYSGSFDGTPVFLGCSDVDNHIPAARVRLTADVFTRLGARVDLRFYPGMGHLVNDDELAAVRSLSLALPRA